MNTLDPAALAIVEALKNPALSTAQQGALLGALRACTTPEVPPRTPPRPARAVADAARGDRVSLTKTAVAALPLPAKGERLVWDTVTPQLAVRLRPSGRSYIVIVWDRLRNRKTTLTLGKCSAVTPDQARAQAQRAVGAVADGKDIRRARAVGLTVRQLLDAWQAEKGAGVRTAAELKAKALHYLGTLAERPAADITREDIGRIHSHIATKSRRRVVKGSGVAKQAVEIGDPGMPATADKWRATLAAVYTWAGKKGLVSANPCEGVPNAFDAKGAARTNYLRGDSLLKFWKALDADADADVRDALLLMLFSGQRRGNVLTMRWADVDLTACVWALDASQTKQRKAQTTPLVTQAVEILARRWQSAGTPWVFPATRAVKCEVIGAMSETRLRDAWARVCKAAGIEGLRPHDLRHTSGSWLARLGASEAVRQKALGHQTPAMAARYSHLELDPVADALQRVADAVQAEATKPVAISRRAKSA